MKCLLGARLVELTRGFEDAAAGPGVKESVAEHDVGRRLQMLLLFTI